MSTTQAARAAVMKSSGLNVLLLLLLTGLEAKSAVPCRLILLTFCQNRPADVGAADLIMCREDATTICLL